MKQRIFNKGKGWYISASNYKDKEDKAFMNVHFAKCEEPIYKKAGDNDFVFVDIDIQEMKYGAYKGKINLTVFKYELIHNDSKYTEMDKFAEEMKPYSDKFGATQSIEIDESELPFY